MKVDTPFKDTEIHLHKIDVWLMKGQVKYNPPYCWIWRNMNVLGKPTQTNLMGDVLIQIFNFGKQEDLSLFIVGSGIIKAGGSKKASEVFHQLIEYLFSWANDYVIENNIKDEEDNPFIVPQFAYQESDFQTLFGEEQGNKV